MDTANRLAAESSPYLLQHAENPVHWLPWNPASLDLARQLHRPILLSIGYSSCHWCHVMAHESFEDPETAEVMNQLFINIKVDREERPDLDKIYQNAHSLLTERPGGWPLTVFLTPDDHMPIFAGTYFPKTASHGLPAFKDLLRNINDIWINRRQDIRNQSTAIRSVYERIYDSTRPDNQNLDHSPIDLARSQLTRQFDSQNGGFSRAPKFPHPAILDFALQHWRKSEMPGQGDTQVLHYVMFTLERMANGGMFDHIGGGFCRYSTDDQWMIPHFEKMLYDNGPLLGLYAQAYQIDRNPLFKNAAEQTAKWVMREMQSETGGYYSAQDADSEGCEGKFFIWSADEIHQLLEQAANEYRITEPVIRAFCKKYGLDRTANFEGHWHFHTCYTTEQAIDEPNSSITETEQQFASIRSVFFQYREKRVHPATDTKSLVSWNSLMIHGMSRAGRLLNNDAFNDSALKAARFIRSSCWSDQRLAGCYINGHAKQPAYLDDYAFLIYALLELLQSRWDNEIYMWSLELADSLILQFEDNHNGGFFYTARDHEPLIQQLKPFADDAMPSGNSIACLALNRLGYLSGNTDYLNASERCLQSAWSNIQQSPLAHSAMVMALYEYLSPPGIFIIRQHGTDPDNSSWQQVVQRYCLQDSLLYTIDSNLDLPVSLSNKSARQHTVAYPCRGLECYQRLESAEEFQQYLRNNSYRVLE